MRHVKDLVPGAMTAGHAHAEPTPAPAALDPAAIQIVNKLFADLQVIFTGWRYSWPDNAALAAAKRNWVQAFMAAGIRDERQIKFGLDRCRLHTKDFAPSPGTFIEWCKPAPEALGCPDVRTAYRMACRLAHPTADREGVHPAVWHAACETGLHELRELPERDSRPLFERNYGLTLGMVERGQPLREIPKALPEAVSVPSTKERARSCLAQMRQGLLGAATA